MMALSEKKRAYHTKYLRDRYHNDPEYRAKHLSIVSAANKRKSEKVRQLIEDFRKNGCGRCSEKDPCCLTAHHVDPTQKDFLVSRAKRINPERVRRELSKCLCLCMNCHAKLHASESVGREGLEPPTHDHMRAGF